MCCLRLGIPLKISEIKSKCPAGDNGQNLLRFDKFVLGLVFQEKRLSAWDLRFKPYD